MSRTRTHANEGLLLEIHPPWRSDTAVCLAGPCHDAHLLQLGSSSEETRNKAYETTISPELVDWGLWHFVGGVADDPASNLSSRECESNALESGSTIDSVAEQDYMMVLTAS
jgi:hypothetical protein